MKEIKKILNELIWQELDSGWTAHDFQDIMIKQVDDIISQINALHKADKIKTLEACEEALCWFVNRKNCHKVETQFDLEKMLREAIERER